MSGIGKQLRGSGIAKLGFKSKHDVVSHERKRYADGPDQEGVQPDNDTYGEKNYDKNNINRKMREKERNYIKKDSFDKNVDIYENEEINDSPAKKMIKYGYRKVKDPIDKLTRSIYEDAGDKSARKKILGYKKGGKAKKKK
jgi:hypothetical protein